MAGNGIAEFLSEVKQNDLARSHRFEVIMGTPKCMEGKGQPNHISLMCEEAIFPGLMMGSKPFKYNNRVENRATI
jgi:alpha-D-ribose 1-methylphosphonate 5-triphosphate diphosphatase PhnM